MHTETLGRHTHVMIVGRSKELTLRGKGNQATLPPIDRLKSTKRTCSLSSKKVSKKNNFKTPPLISLCDEMKSDPFQEAERLLRELPDPTPGKCGLAKVKFNHYNKSFPLHNGVMKWSDIDNEYCLSFVYRGNFRRDLIPKLLEPRPDVKVRRDNFGVYFLEMSTFTEYTLEVEEDPLAGIGAEGLRIREGPIIRELHSSHSPRAKSSLKSGNVAVQDITNTLLGMDASQLHSEEAKMLREQRDIEDVLFS
jgi:hypothetical protein